MAQVEKEFTDICQEHSPAPGGSREEASSAPRCLSHSAQFQVSSNLWHLLYLSSVLEQVKDGLSAAGEPLSAWFPVSLFGGRL